MLSGILKVHNISGRMLLQIIEVLSIRPTALMLCASDATRTGESRVSVFADMLCMTTLRIIFSIAPYYCATVSHISPVIVRLLIKKFS
jgi:hypothetical protein